MTECSDFFVVFTFFQVIMRFFCAYGCITDLQKKSIAMEKKRWNMVVDTNCFLHKESRKALQLLQGLKGTQFIIPRIGNQFSRRCFLFPYLSQVYPTFLCEVFSLLTNTGNAF